MSDAFVRSLDALMQGGVCVIPTDTVYGLVARALDEAAVRKLYTLKPRELSPGTIIAADIEQLAVLGFELQHLERVEQFWPGAISVVLPAPGVPAYLKGKRTDLAVRLPDVAELHNLLEKTGPLMTTSANTPKAPTAQTIDEARAYFGEQVDYYADAGDLGDRPPSTIIQVDDSGEIILLRAGAVTIESA